MKLSRGTGKVFFRSSVSQILVLLTSCTFLPGQPLSLLPVIRLKIDFCRKKGEGKSAVKKYIWLSETGSMPKYLARNGNVPHSTGPIVKMKLDFLKLTIICIAISMPNAVISICSKKKTKRTDIDEFL